MALWRIKKTYKNKEKENRYKRYKKRCRPVQAGIRIVLVERTSLIVFLSLVWLEQKFLVGIKLVEYEDSKQIMKFGGNLHREVKNGSVEQ